MKIISSIPLAPGITHRMFNYLNYNSIETNDNLLNPGIVSFDHTFFNVDHMVDRRALRSSFPDHYYLGIINQLPYMNEY